MSGVMCQEVGVTYCTVDKNSPITERCFRRKYWRINVSQNYKEIGYIDICGYEKEINQKFLTLLQHWNRSNNWSYAPLQ